MDTTAISNASARSRPTGDVLGRLSNWAGLLSGWLVIASAFAIGWEIASRALFNQATIWVFDVASYSLVWFSYLACACVLRERRHLSVDIYTLQLGEAAKLALDAVGIALITLIAAALAWYSWVSTHESWVAGEVEPTILQAPVWMVTIGMAIGLTLTALQGVSEFIKNLLEVRTRLRGGESGRSALFNVALLLGSMGVSLALMATGYDVGGLVLLLLVQLFFGVPVFAALLFTGLAGFYFIFDVQMAVTQSQQVAFKATISYTLLAVPLYVMAGNILQAGRIGPSLYSLASAWIGHIRGGHAVATVLACGVFAAISGSSVATAATIGAMAIPEMLRRGYDERFVYGLVAAGGTLGILIPPSTPMILFSSMTDESTGALFMGGVVPGLMLLGLLAAYAIYASKGISTPPAPWSERKKATKEAIWGVLAPVIVLAGIYTGIFTPTEAAAVVVIYALVVTLLTGTVKLRDLPAILIDGVWVSGMIMMITAGALVLGTVTTILQLPTALVSFVETAEIAPWVVFALLIVFYVILGMFLEVVSILLITLPIIYPLVTSLGFNGLWFGIVLVVLMELALITPPVGLNLFTVQAITRAPLKRVIAGVTPFILLMVGLFALLVAFPILIHWLPGTMGYSF